MFDPTFQREEVKLTEEIKKLKQEKQALEVDLEKMKKECNMAKEQLTNTSGELLVVQLTNSFVGIG